MQNKISKFQNFKIPSSVFDCSNSCLFRYNMCYEYYTAFGLQNREECPASKSHQCCHCRGKKVVYYSISTPFPTATTTAKETVPTHHRKAYTVQFSTVLFQFLLWQQIVIVLQSDISQSMSMQSACDTNIFHVKLLENTCHSILSVYLHFLS